MNVLSLPKKYRGREIWATSVGTRLAPILVLEHSSRVCFPVARERAFLYQTPAASLGHRSSVAYFTFLKIRNEQQWTGHVFGHVFVFMTDTYSCASGSSCS